MIVSIDFDCSGFNPQNEDYIRYIILNWCEERGLFKEEEGRPVIKPCEK